jgi:hypothetical protein
VGANAGAPARARLWFAEKDAARFAATLRELGDFPEGHLVLLQGRPVAEVRRGLQATEAALLRARAAGQRTLLVFYFSGHASAGALEVGEERLDFGELKGAMESSAADVKVAIVDACESGGLTQVKGARPSRVDFALPTDETARGVAYIASTASGEVAQESAAIGASFFTYHLEAALRGAGDANGDGQVSLSEAFQYTSGRTTSGTSATDVGPQHPTYNFRMAGRGDVMLSDLRRAESRLALPAGADATWVVSRRGRVVAEAPGGLVLALPAGDYHVERHQGRAAAGAEVTLLAGQIQRVGELSESSALARGKGAFADALDNALSASFSLEVPWVAGQLAPMGVLLAFRRTLAGPHALRLSAGYADGTGTLPTSAAAYRVQSGSLALAWLARLVDAQVWVDVGAEVGGGFHLQTVAGAGHGAFSGLAGATAGLGVRLGPVVPQLQVTGGARLVSVDAALVVRPHVQGLLGVAVEF